MNDLKDIIREHLIETFQGDTQIITAQKLNTTQGNISKWITGQQIPTTDMLWEISKAYKVSVDWLLGISEQKEIDGVELEKLTYEKIARVLDKLIELGTIVIPDLQELQKGNQGEEEEEDEEGDTSSKEPIIDPDYFKINDRVLSFMLRRRLKLYEVGTDFAEMWKTESLPRYRGLKLLPYQGNMGEAIDVRTWATFSADGDWIAMVQELGAMTEQQRDILIENHNKEKDRKKDG